MQQQQQSLRALKARARSPFCLRIAANAHRPIINMILYDSFQYTSIVVMLRWNKFQLKLPRDYDVHSSLWQLEDFLLLQSEN